MASAENDALDDDDAMITGINVTPLVDIVLVLLIIVMVTATYIVKESIEVELPRAAHAGEATGTTLAIVLTKEGDVYLNGAKATEAGLRARAHEAATASGDVRAIISADKNSLHGAVVRVIDVVKGAGISRFAINIEKEN